MFKKVFVSLMVLVLSSAVCAENIVEKEDIVVTAEKRSSGVSKVAREVTVVTAKEIEEKGATTVAEALKSQPGVYITDITGNGKSAVVDLRGQGETAATNIAVYIDGIKQNSMDMSGSDFLTLDVNEIERIEIVKGANSVLYGDRAIGGAVNIITKKIKSDKIFSGSVAVIGEGDGSNKESLRLNLNTGKIRSYISGGNNRKEGYRDNSELHAYDFAYYIEGDISKNSSLSGKITYHKDECGLPGSLKMADMEENRKKSKYMSDFAKIELKSAELQHVYDIENFEIRNSLVVSEREKKYLMFNKYKGDIEGKKINFISEGRYKAGKNSIIFGTDCLNEESKDGSEKTNKKSLEGYVSDFYKLAESLEINGGARTGVTELEFTGGKERSYKKSVFETGIKYSYSNSGMVYGRYGMGYRVPATDEYYDSYSGSFMESLKPQESSDFEIGIKDYFEYIGKIESSLFYSELKDEIYYDNDEYINKNRSGKTKRKGLEIKREQTIWDIESYQSVSYIKTELEETGKEIPGVPKLKGAAGFNWEITENSKINIEAVYTGKKYALSDEMNKYGKVSPYTVLNCEARQNIKTVTLFAGIKNLTNKKYCEYILNSTGNASYYPSAERSYYAGVTYKF